MSGKFSLIFGWLGNEEQCESLKSEYEKLYPLYKQLYRCNPVN